MKKVMVFGTFDGLHEGHLFFLEKAALLGKVIVVVARDEHVQELKGYAPRQPLQKRILALRQMFPSFDITPGDLVLHSWKVVLKAEPDIIALGYDQKDLGMALMKALNEIKVRPEIHIFPPHQGDKLHSSLLRH